MDTKTIGIDKHEEVGPQTWGKAHFFVFLLALIALASFITYRATNQAALERECVEVGFQGENLNESALYCAYSPADAE